MQSKFEFDIITPGLNGNKGLMRMHWSKKKQWYEKISWLIIEQMQGKHKGKVKVSYTRYSTKLLDPMDNLPASAKFWMDCLVKCGVIKDDSSEYVVAPELCQEKVKSLKDIKTVIVIQDIDG